MARPEAGSGAELTRQRAEAAVETLDQGDAAAAFTEQAIGGDGADLASVRRLADGLVATGRRSPGLSLLVRFAVVALLVVTPWLLRNWIQLGQPLLVTSNGFNLSALYSYEARESDSWVDGVYDPRFEDVRRGITDEVALDEALKGHAMEAIADDPLYVIRGRGTEPAALVRAEPEGQRKPGVARRAQLAGPPGCSSSLLHCDGARALGNVEAVATRQGPAAGHRGRLLHGYKPRLDRRSEVAHPL